MSEEPLNIEPLTPEDMPLTSVALELGAKLRLRLAELEHEEHQAWAHVNAVCGASGEIRRILAEMNDVQPQ